MEGKILQILIPARPVQEGAFWSVYCDVLGLASCGDSEQEAKSNLDKAISLYCDALDRKGLLISRLKEKGIGYRVVDIPQSEHDSHVQLRPVLVGNH